MSEALEQPAIRELNCDVDRAPWTRLLHRACAGFGAMGLNHTAEDQSVATTAPPVAAPRQFVVDPVRWPGKVYRSVVLAKHLTDGSQDG